MTAYTDNNIEDWDFRTNCDAESPDYDVEADAFVDEHYATIVAVDNLRLTFIKSFLRGGVAEFDDDRRHVQITRVNPDAWISGARSAQSRFARGGRFTRTVLQSMRREYAKYGRLRLTILPATAERPGVAEVFPPSSD